LSASAHRLDAPNARGHAGLVQDAEQTDLARIPHVRPAAQLHREPGDRDDAHRVPILLAEERHGASRQRLAVRHLPEVYRHGAPDLLVDQSLDLLQPLLTHGAVSGATSDPA
jgi:hypothetical protein